MPSRLMQTPNFFGDVAPVSWAAQHIETTGISFLVRGGTAQDWVAAMQAQCAKAELVTDLYMKAKAGDGDAIKQIAQETGHDYESTANFIQQGDDDGGQVLAGLLAALGSGPDSTITNRL